MGLRSAQFQTLEVLYSAWALWAAGLVKCEFWKCFLKFGLSEKHTKFKKNLPPGLEVYWVNVHDNTFWYRVIFCMKFWWFLAYLLMHTTRR